KDPSSVDRTWHEFFDASPGAASSPGGNGAGRGDAPGSDAAPRKSADVTIDDVTPDATREDVSQKPPADAPARSKSRGKAVPAPARAPATSQKPEAPAPKEPEAPVYSPPEETEHKVLRGPANAIVKNMNASLSLPTATSVRAVPAKAMIDNRVVINNHLKRTHGGKISFTHLIG